MNRRAFILPVVALLMAVFATFACRAAAGISLGMFFGAVGFATLLVPPLAVAGKTIRCRLVIAGAITLGISLTWLTAVGERVTFPQYLSCTAVLTTYTFALAGMAAVCLPLRVNPFLTSGITTTFALLWLTWPVWLSHALLLPAGDALVSWLVPAHPLFAINGVLAQFETWDRYPLAYGQLTVLNQDVFYALPTTIAPTLLLHGAIAAITFAAAWWRESSRPVNEPDASPAGAAPDLAAPAK